MSNLESLKQSNPIAYTVLKNSYFKNKISHAYIFSGHQNVETLSPAYALIELLISDGNLFAGDLPRQIQNYPDLYIITPQDHDIHKMHEITKDDVKNMLKNLELKALDFKGVKILLIHHVEKLNHQAVNVLLKFLEFPKSKTYVIMTTNFIHSVANTIKSRAIEVKIHNFSQNYLVDKIVNSGYKHNIAQVISFFCKNPQDAIKILKETNFLHLYKDIMNILQKITLNPATLISHLSPIIDHQNYKLVINIILVFLYDVINYQQNLPINNLDYISLIAAYTTIKFNSSQAIQTINQFLIVQNYLVNFNLSKNQLLLQLEKCYE